jgi:hypothetical protein
MYGRSIFPRLKRREPLRLEADVQTLFNRRMLVVLMASFAIVAAVVYVVQAPIRNASRIKVGDDAARVHRLLGPPEAIFETTAELKESYLGPMSFVFSDDIGGSGMKLDDLPPVAARVEWFEYESAGHLVYYDENGVTRVLWGGT